MLTPVLQLDLALRAKNIPIDGVSEIAEGEYRIDFADNATDQQQVEGLAIASNFTPTPDPKWQEFISRFQYPGNKLYTAVVGQVKQAGFEVQDHWSNFKQMAASEELRSAEGLAAGIWHLAQLLDGAGHPLSPSAIDAWNQLMLECDFPDSCKL